MPRDLVLVTNSWPFGGLTERSFILPAIEPFVKFFRRVVILPMHSAGPLGAAPEELHGAELYTAHFPAMGRANRFRHAFHKEVALSAADALKHGLSPKGAATYAAAALEWRDLFRILVSDLGLDPATTLFYNFWLDAPASGLALLAKEWRAEGKALHMVVRVNGFDLRERRSPRLKEMAVCAAHGVYPVSRAAAGELRRLYPRGAQNVHVKYLGCQGPHCPAPAPGPDDPLRILSIGRVIPLKRVHLVLKLAKELARALPDRNVEWVHFGDGSSMASLRARAKDDLPPNLSVNLAGAIPNSKVQAYLAKNPVTWMASMSTAEGGLPVSLCEGAAYGVPAVATAVGGVPELVEEGVTGLLADTDPDIGHLVKRMVRYCSDTKAYGSMREAARRKWELELNASELRLLCAKRLAQGLWE